MNSRKYASADVRNSAEGDVKSCCAAKATAEAVNWEILGKLNRLETNEVGDLLFLKERLSASRKICC